MPFDWHPCYLLMVPWCDGLDGLCILGILRFEKKAAVSLGHGQGPKAEFTIKEGKTGGATAALRWIPRPRKGRYSNTFLNDDSCKDDGCLHELCDNFHATILTL